MSDVRKIAGEVMTWLFDVNASETSDIEMAWVDIETTGLSSATDEILEVAILLTDKHGGTVAAFSAIATWLDPAAERSLAEGAVAEMHDKSGLWSAISEGGDAFTELHDAPSTPAAMSDSIENFLESYLPTDRKLPLSGSSVHFDRRFLERDMPDVMGRFFTHRNIDVSTMFGLAEMHNEPLARDIVAEVASLRFHRGLADLRDTIRLYQELLEDFLWTSEDARAVSAHLGEGGK